MVTTGGANTVVETVLSALVNTWTFRLFRWHRRRILLTYTSLAQIIRDNLTHFSTDRAVADLAISETMNETDEARTLAKSQLIKAPSPTCISSITTKSYPERLAIPSVVVIPKTCLPMDDLPQVNPPIDDSTKVQPRYLTSEDVVNHNENDKIGTIPATSKMKLYVRAKCPPPNTGTSLLDPRIQKLVEYRERKNAMSRERAKNHRQSIAAITTKNLDEMTEHDFNLFTSHAAFRSRKNMRSRERSLEKKKEKERIMMKPVVNRTLLERKFLKNSIATNRHKIEGDRRRRKKYKAEKCDKHSCHWNPQSSSLILPGSWSATGNNAIAAIWPPYQEAYQGMIGMENQYSSMKKFDVNCAGMNTGVIINAAAAAGVLPLPCYQHLTNSRTIVQWPEGGREPPTYQEVVSTTTCAAQEVINPHCLNNNIPCSGGQVQNYPYHCHVSGHDREFCAGCAEGGAAVLSPAPLYGGSPHDFASLLGQHHRHVLGSFTTIDGADGHKSLHQPLFLLGSATTPRTLSEPWWPPSSDHHQFMELSPPLSLLVPTDTTVLNDGMITFPPHITVPVMQGSQEEGRNVQQQSTCIGSFGGAGTALIQELLLGCDPLTTLGTMTNNVQHDIISPFVLMSGSHESKLNAPLEERNELDELAPLVDSFIVKDDEDEATVETIEWVD